MSKENVSKTYVIGPTYSSRFSRARMSRISVDFDAAALALDCRRCCSDPCWLRARLSRCSLPEGR